MLDTSIKVLVVDDMSTMRRIVKNVLKQIGYENIVESEHGQDALNKLKGGGFGLVVSDWNMPVMSGIDLLRAVQAGVSNYVVKPFTAEALQEKLKKIFAKK